MTDAITFAWTHRADILAAITLLMTTIVGIAHGLELTGGGFVWLGGQMRRLAKLTSSKADDRAAERFETLAKRFDAWARRMSRGADWLAAQHARLMPRPRSTNPQPETVR